MAKVSKAETARRNAEIDEMLAKAAENHTAENPDHGTVNWPGNGWGCKVCDPDLFKDETN